MYKQKYRNFAHRPRLVNFAGMVEKIISTLSSIKSIKVTTNVTVPFSTDFVTNKLTVVSELETLNTGKIKTNRTLATNGLGF